MNLQSFKLRRALQVILGAYWLLILTLTHLPPKHLPHVNVRDKIEHLMAYGCLGGLVFLALWSMRPRIVHLGIIVLAICMIYGALDEWTQPFFGRDCDLMDWTADTAGAAIAAVCLTFIRAILKSEI